MASYDVLRTKWLTVSVFFFGRRGGGEGEGGGYRVSSCD